MTSPSATPSTATVYLYNTTNQTVDFTVNGSAAITIPAAAPPAYAPATPTGSEPVLTISQFPGPGNFGLINNQCSLAIASGGNSQQFNVDLSNITATMINSAQLFVFFKNITQISWVFLINGQPICGSLSGPMGSMSGSLS